ncbi:MAG: hypothetical protein ACE5HC_09510 [Candidatus Binatia bacterium]
MGKTSTESSSRHLFDLGSRLGCLEGYLYSKRKVEERYLLGWLQNIDREFTNLPAEVESEIEEDYLALLKKVHALLRREYGTKDTNTLQAEQMISRRRGSTL